MPEHPGIYVQLLETRGRRGSEQGVSVFVSGVFIDSQPLLESTARWVLEGRADPWAQVVRYLLAGRSAPAKYREKKYLNPGGLC